MFLLTKSEMNLDISEFIWGNFLYFVPNYFPSFYFNNDPNNPLKDTARFKKFIFSAISFFVPQRPHKTTDKSIRVTSFFLLRVMLLLHTAGMLAKKKKESHNFLN